MKNMALRSFVDSQCSAVRYRITGLLSKKNGLYAAIVMVLVAGEVEK